MTDAEICASLTSRRPFLIEDAKRHGSTQWLELQADMGGNLAIHDMMYWPEREALIEIARGLPSNALYVEIGIADGSTTAMMVRANPTLRCVGIDPLVDHDGDDNGYRRVGLNLRMSGLEGVMILLRAKSENIGPYWSTPIDCLLIDGDHNAPVPEHDLRVFGPWVKPGGWLLLDDYHGQDVREAWEKVSPTLWGGQCMAWPAIEGCRSHKLVIARRPG